MVRDALLVPVHPCSSQSSAQGTVYDALRPLVPPQACRLHLFAQQTSGTPPVMPGTLVLPGAIKKTLG